VIQLKTGRDIERMRQSGAIAAQVAAEVRRMIKPGVTTAQLDHVAERHIVALGGKPGFKGLYGFPASLCISVNNEIVHGVPSDRILQPGDIVSVDLGVVRRGWCSDMAFTAAVGNISVAAQHLLAYTEKALYAAIEAARIGRRLGDVGAAVEQTATAGGLSVVREYGGHGIGRKMHEEPWIANFGVAGTGTLLVRGMTLALEPMFNIGGPDAATVDCDGWPVVVTKDGSLSAHFEHTVAITEDGPIVLTAGVG